MTDRQRKIEELSAVKERLTNGWAACEAEGDPAKRRRYEDVWLRILGQYQSLHDEIYGTEGVYEIVPRMNE